MIVLNVDGQVIVLVGTSQEMCENTGQCEGVWLVEDMLEEVAQTRVIFQRREAFFERASSSTKWLDA